MQYRIVKRVNANSLSEAIRNEPFGEIVYSELIDEEDYKPLIGKSLGYGG